MSFSVKFDSENPHLILHLQSSHYRLFILVILLTPCRWAGWYIRICHGCCRQSSRWHPIMTISNVAWKLPNKWGANSENCQCMTITPRWWLLAKSFTQCNSALAFQYAAWYECRNNFHDSSQWAAHYRCWNIVHDSFLAPFLKYVSYTI